MFPRVLERIMPLNRMPKVVKCCVCVSDLKTAVAIIAVLGIVTSPSLSWAIVRHSYVLRVSCYVTTGGTRQDVVDINLKNVFSFGFGVNAGLGPSCLGPTQSPNNVVTDPVSNSDFVTIVKYFGWVVLLTDLLFVLSSVNLFIRLFKTGVKKAAKCFMTMAILSVPLSFVYSMMYVVSCLLVGGAFPLFEFFFSLFDVLLWTYFLIVVNSYRHSANPNS